MNLLSLRFGSLWGPARVKRARRGMERDWNRFGDPQKKLWRGHYDKTSWLEYRNRKFNISLDNSN
jgi:hypothetical protein